MKIFIQSTVLLLASFYSISNISSIEFESFIINEVKDDLVKNRKNEKNKIGDFLWMKGNYKLDTDSVEIQFLKNNEIKGKGFSIKQRGEKLILNFENKSYTYKNVLEEVFYFQDKSSGDMVGADGMIYYFENANGEKVEIFRFDYKRYFSIQQKDKKGKKLAEKLYSKI